MGRAVDYTVSQKGAGLIEVMVALFILAIAFSSIHVMQINNHVVMVNLEMKKAARVAAGEIMQELRLLGANAIVNGERSFIDTTHATGSDTPVTRNITVEWVGLNTLDTNGVLLSKEVQVTSRWTVKGIVQSVQHTIVVPAL